MFGMSTPRQPIPGLDVAGTVVALGPGAEGFSVGDRVFGIAAGSFAEYAVATTTSITHLPDGVSFEDAAALPVVPT
jgi:NADPH:quinone reductase-like Zn-dependent oxidoreductase